MNDDQHMHHEGWKYDPTNFVKKVVAQTFVEET